MRLPLQRAPKLIYSTKTWENPFMATFGVRRVDTIVQNVLFVFLCSTWWHTGGLRTFMSNELRHLCSVGFNPAATSYFCLFNTTTCLFMTPASDHMIKLMSIISIHDSANLHSALIGSFPCVMTANTSPPFFLISSCLWGGGYPSDWSCVSAELYAAFPALVVYESWRSVSTI